ncbi:TonB-dependent receptor [Terriglobus aquaticus]|uniref:Carboxypeptidase regulatory-like domain-containing protein n=1 Tax=Terriglobus aquaticus TaxID=940139 RepID=A0ABW9KPI3_9BACT|nr:TonB-dependent receptor [Terriglobus aquaticus]
MKKNAVKFLLAPALLPVSATLSTTAIALAPFVIGLMPAGSAMAQTYRGGVAGTVLDASGAVVPNAKVTLLDPSTGFTRTQQSTSAGAYAFQDLPIGQYTVTVEAQGFSVTKVEKIDVRPGAVYSLDPKLGVGAETQSVDVNAAALALDTETTANNSVVNEKAVQNIPLNGRDYTQLIKIVPGYNGAGSLNGTRSNQNNYQIDGADSNDIWQNGAAANQGGVGSIAGVTIPIDAIDQFTVQSNANAEAGRNVGGLISLAIKTGTNNVHGSAYYFNRNEFFAARSPFLSPTTRKPTLRNQQFGGSVGAPIIKDKLFFFVNYERQMFLIGNSAAATEPTTAYVNAATALLQAHGYRYSPTSVVNPLSLNLLTLWPEGNKNVGPAASGNYFDPRNQKGYSDNAIGNITWNMTSRQNLRLQAFVGTGRQYSAVGTNVYDYFQVAPDITQNFSLAHNWAISDRVSNQLLFGVGVFNQTFNDANHSFNLPSLGLATGVTDPTLFGAPNITIGGGAIDVTGQTPPLGRKDYTGHVTDAATFVKGKHQFRFGGEYRRNYMDLQYQRNVRGTFSFNGTASSNAAITPLLNGATPWANDASVGTDVRSLADYLAGFYNSNSFVQGYLRRSIYQNTFAGFVQDQFQVTPKLTLNYGLRYEYNAPWSSPGFFSFYRPGNPAADGYGLVPLGSGGVDKPYNGQQTNFSPRVGVAYQLNPVMVLRGTYGLYFDAPNFNGFFDNGPGNGGARGPQANPTGPNPVRTVSKTYGQWVSGVNPFPTAPSPTTIYGLATIDPNFATARSHNWTVNMETQLARNTIFTLGYVGAAGRDLFNLSDINQARPGTTTSATAEVTRRPIYVNRTVPNYATIGAVNEIESRGYSNYDSLQASLRISNIKGLTAQGSYTWGHALDVISSTRNLAPQDSANLAAEYGDSDFDVRSTFNGYVVYEVPHFSDKLKVLTQGWQGNAFVTAFTGTPFSVKVGNDISGTGENQDRANYVPGATYKVSNKVIVPTTGQPYAQFFNPAAFVSPAAGNFGTTRRNAFRGPNFFTTDASLVKNTRLREGVNLQIRAEMFNIFNYTNLANPTATLTSSTLGRSTNTRNNGGAPGIGPGEPFNVQFAGKIIF